MSPAAAANGASSSSSKILNAADALKELATYATGDGLSMDELIDSRVHGGLTYNGESERALH